MQQDERWKQRFASFEKALEQLTSAINNNGANPVDIIKEGIIHRFKFTHELAWKVMKYFLKHKGFKNINGPKSATREAFNKSLVENGQSWMDMIESRNKTVHTYSEEILQTEFERIINNYFLPEKYFIQNNFYTKTRIYSFN